MPDVARLEAVITADTEGLERGLKSSEKGISAFAKVGTAALVGAGVAIAGAGAAAVKSAMDFEQTMSGVKAVAGASNAEMTQLHDLALQLGKDTVYSAAEAAQGIEELVKGGLSVQDVMAGGAKAMLNLAAAGGVDLPEAATIAANALNQFNLKGTDMAHVSDLIAGAANASAIDVHDFGYSLAQAGAAAALNGMRFDDLAVAIAEMGKNGIRGSDAGTSLKTMLDRLQPSTKAAKAEMQELGLWTAQGGSAFFDAQGKMKPLVEIQGLLANATKNLTDAQRAQALSTIFGSDAMRAAAVLTKEGSAGFTEMAGAMGKVTAESVALERLNNLWGDVKQLTGSLETLAITVGEALLPELRGMVQWVTGVVNALIPLARDWLPRAVGLIGDTAEALRSIWVNGEPTALVKKFEEWAGVDLNPLIVKVYGLAESLRSVLALIEREGLRNALGDLFKDFEPSVARVARLVDSLGRMLAEDARAVEGVMRFFGAFSDQLEHRDIGVLEALALRVNAITAEWEKNIDAAQKVVDWILKIQQAWSNLFSFAQGHPLSSAIVSAIPGVTVPQAPAGPQPLPGGVTVVPRRDRGGPVAPGNLYEIGQGPYREYFVPGAAGMVHPMGGGGGPVTVPVYLGDELLTTVVARASQRYYDRGGYVPRSSIPPPVVR